MKRTKWQILLGASLLGLSALVYLLHYLIFRDAHHIFLYLVGDVAFVFVEVLLVTLIIHGVLEDRERKGRLQKLNMVIGVFFSEVGTELLRVMARQDPDIEKLRAAMSEKEESHGRVLSRIRKCVQSHDYSVTPMTVGWESMSTLLIGKRNFLVRLLENQNLLEHTAFTDLLWTVFHLTEELDARPGFHGLPDTDLQHLGGDMKRVYRRLALQWVAYMEHLSAGYPYLFSLALRMNPFDPTTSPVVSEA